MKEKPVARIAIDGSMYKSGNQYLSDSRSRSIRDALIKAGVSADRIQIGAYGDKKRSARRPKPRYCSAPSTKALQLIR
jgi:outer membrane protein OmpA-like peptidoglycan-associated protein